MIYRMLADATVVLHLGFVLFVIGGGILVWRYPRLAWLHVPAALWGAFIEFAGWVCPLTPLENRLREQAGQQAYATSFVEHYLMPVLYPQSLTRDVQWVLGGMVLVVNVILYALILRRTRRTVGA